MRVKTAPLHPAGLCTGVESMPLHPANHARAQKARLCIHEPAGLHVQGMQQRKFLPPLARKCAPASRKPCTGAKTAPLHLRTRGRGSKRTHMQHIRWPAEANGRICNVAAPKTAQKCSHCPVFRPADLLSRQLWVAAASFCFRGSADALHMRPFASACPACRCSSVV